VAPRDANGSIVAAQHPQHCHPTTCTNVELHLFLRRLAMYEPELVHWIWYVNR
jgi:hypothetical protein